MEKFTLGQWDFHIRPKRRGSAPEIEAREVIIRGGSGLHAFKALASAFHILEQHTEIHGVTLVYPRPACFEDGAGGCIANVAVPSSRSRRRRSQLPMSR